MKKNLGENHPHDSAVSHVTGESIFIDDRPAFPDEIFVGILTSPVASGKIKKIDTALAEAHPDVLGIFRGGDFHDNYWGTIVKEQPLLADPIVAYMDEPIALIAMRRRDALNEIKKLITVDIEEIPALFTIDEARAKQQFICEATPFIRGDVEKALAQSPHTLSGVFECGGQEHFYLENQAAIAYPMENGQIEIHSSSQHPSETQHLVAHAIGAPFSDVVSIVKRMGGGFGGKESQAAPFAAYAALVAKKFKRPARCVITKDEDMKITGKRHPFKIFYTVGFDQQGKILGLKADLYADGGAYTDLSPSILDRAMFHLDGAYYLPHVAIKGYCCRTNNHSNTAFRGFGGPQGNMAIESILEDMAVFLRLDSFKIRELNCYGIEKDNVTPYGQIVENNLLPKIFKELRDLSGYEKRAKAIKEFNQEKSGKVRGLSVTATKFGIAFTARFLNQANALVNVHLDGTVQVSTGATEMGQGVNTKIAQIVADAFGISLKQVRVMTTSTEKNHNTSPTAASSGSDLNGAAALMACNAIKKRLMLLAQKIFDGEEVSDTKEYCLPEDSPLKLENYLFIDEKITNTATDNSIDWKKIISKAYMHRISLGEYAHYKTPNLGFDKKKLSGRAFNYFTMGAAVSEVEIDEYTGELKVLRTDILMDVGKSINPGIDKGQITGAFIQAMGWVTTEKLFYNQKRQLVSHSPTTYKIPNIQDTPRIFNVSFIDNDSTVMNVHRSKAVGEPPFLLGTSVWTAIKNALSARFPGVVVDLKSPATSEEIILTLSKLAGDRDGKKL